VSEETRRRAPRRFPRFVGCCERAAQPGDSAALRFGPFRLDRGTQVWRGKDVVASHAGIRHLHLLVRIVDACWRGRPDQDALAYTFVEEGSLSNISFCCERPWVRIQRSLKRSAARLPLCWRRPTVPACAERIHKNHSLEGHSIGERGASGLAADRAPSLSPQLQWR